MRDIHFYDRERRKIMLGTGQVESVPATVLAQSQSDQRDLQEVRNWAVRSGLIERDTEVACWM